MDREFLSALAEVVIERDLWVISDEAYEHLLFDGAVHVSLASLPGMAERTVTVWTLSKSYAMTGWRVGYVLSPPVLRGVLGPVLAFYSTHGVFPAVQLAARAAITGRRTRSRRCAPRTTSVGDLLLAGARGPPGVRVPAPRGRLLRVPGRGGRAGWRRCFDRRRRGGGRRGMPGSSSQSSLRRMSKRSRER